MARKLEAANVNHIVLAVLAFFIFFARGRADTEAPPKLLRLARQHFNGDETAKFSHDKEGYGGEKFFRAMAAGVLYSGVSAETQDFQKSDQWPTVEADWINWICTDGSAQKLIPPAGIQISGVRIDGQIAVESENIPFSLDFERCDFFEDLDLYHSQCPQLVLSGSHIRGVNGQFMEIPGGIWMDDGFVAEGKVDFYEAAIGKDFVCTGGTFDNPNGTTLYAESATIKGTVFLDDDGRYFQANGKVDLLGAEIGGDLQCGGGEFSSPGGTTLLLSRAKIAGAVLLGTSYTDDGRFFESTGQVDASGAVIGGSLDCTGGRFENPNDTVLNTEWAKIAGTVFLDSESGSNGRLFHSDGEVDLLGTSIGGDLDCEGGKFSNPDGTALLAARAAVTGCVFFRSSSTNGDRAFESDGQVDVSGAVIGGDLDCRGSQFDNWHDIAIYAESARIAGTVFLTKESGDTDMLFRANGGVDLLGISIGGDLDCMDGQFNNPDGDALRAPRAKITGNVFLDGDFNDDKNVFVANGEVDFISASVGGDLDCTDGEFDNLGGIALNAESMKIGGSALLRSRPRCREVFSEYCRFIVEGLSDLHTTDTGEYLDQYKADMYKNSNWRGFSVDAPDVNAPLFSFDHGAGAVQDGNVKLSAAAGQSIIDDKDFHLNKPHNTAFSTESSQYPGVGIEFNGIVDALGATVGGDFDCGGGAFTAYGGEAINARRTIINGSVFLSRTERKYGWRPFVADGDVLFQSAEIGSSLECDGGSFAAGSAEALSAERANIKGGVFLRTGFQSFGEVDLDNLTVGADLDCSDGSFTRSEYDDNALSVRDTTINGDVYFMHAFRARGYVDFTNSEVAGSLNVDDFAPPNKATFDFEAAKIGTLDDSPSSWKGNRLVLDGFIYNRIFRYSPYDATHRLAWIKQNDNTGFLPKPYEQLAAVLKEMGHDEQVARIMVAMNEEHARYVKKQLALKPFYSRFISSNWWWYNVFGFLVGYGYRPARAFYISLIIVGLGWFLFWLGYYNGIMWPAGDKLPDMDRYGQEPVLDDGHVVLPRDYPRFNSFVYSLEAFTPLLQLDQNAHWRPNANRTGERTVRGKRLKFYGRALRVYLWLHIIAGWILTSLWIGAISGLVKS